MGDVSAEPSMEEILSSIKRIIAEEDSPAGRRRPARAPSPEDHDADEVLELSDPMPPARAAAELPDEAIRATARAAHAQVARAFSGTAPEPEARPAQAYTPPAQPARSPTAAAASPQTPSPQPGETMPRTTPADPILSPAAADATRGALDSLSRMLVKPDPQSASDGTLEGLVREMLRPMLRDWLDAHLPAMVEKMVAQEIARISGQPR